MSTLVSLVSLLVLSCSAEVFLPQNSHNTHSVRTGNARRSLSFYEDNFVDGLETAYNEYAQAWRYIGLYVDCNVVAEEQRRRLEEEANDDEGNDEEGNDDEGNDDEGNDENQEEEEEEVEEEEQDGTQCKRYLLWGAYVDLDYEGSGLSEYRIYDTNEKKWDKSACNAGDSDRCIKMDCHMRGSNFEPLGYFRQANPVEFLQVLAQRQGSCTWDNQVANSVENSMDWLPQECTQTEIKVHNQEGRAAYVYFDLKPTKDAGVDIGLYTDAKCSMEYLGEETTVNAVIAAYTGESVDVSTTVERLNQALNPFKVCSPCRTFDLGSGSSAQNDNNGGDGDGDEEGNDDENNNDDADNSDPNNQNFVCNDAAGNAGTNMCMDFAQNTEIYHATEADVFTASQTGTIRRTWSAADAVESWWDAWGFFLIGCLVFVLGMICFCSVAVKRKRVGSGSRTQPLIGR